MCSREDSLLLYAPPHNACTALREAAKSLIVLVYHSGLGQMPYHEEQPGEKCVNDTRRTTATRKKKLSLLLSFRQINRRAKSSVFCIRTATINSASLR